MLKMKFWFSTIGPLPYLEIIFGSAIFIFLEDSNVIYSWKGFFAIVVDC